MRKVFLLTVWCIVSLLYGQMPVSIVWDDTEHQADTLNIVSFRGAVPSSEYGLLPQFFAQHPLSGSEYASADFTVTLVDAVWEALPSSVRPDFVGSEFVQGQPQLDWYATSSRKRWTLDVYLVPLRKSGSGVERLVSGTLVVNSVSRGIKTKSMTLASDFSNSSVLSSGKWVKVSVPKTGLYRFTYNDIQQMGLDPATVQVFGNGGELLNIYFANRLYDDLQEVSLWFENGSDGKFNAASDYIVFYAVGPDKWSWDQNRGEFVHTQHPFDDKAYYFLTSGRGEAKKMSRKPVEEANHTTIANTFTDYDYFEPMEKNLLESGSEWFGSRTSVGGVFSRRFTSKSLVRDADSKVTVAYAARTTKVHSNVTVQVNNASVGTIDIANSSTSEIGLFASRTVLTSNFKPVADNVDVKLTFNALEETAEGYLDYIRLNLTRDLKYLENGLLFRVPQQVGDNSVVRYEIGDAPGDLLVFDVTDRHNGQWIQPAINENVAAFTNNAATLREYALFNPKSSLPKPTVIGNVTNQNLHGETQPDYVIIAPKQFLGEADRLAQLHREGGLKVLIVTPEEIYNEFSSGSRDLTAFRWFLKMFYDRATDNDDMVRYLLLFGDGTFDNRPNSPLVRNIIPTYQSTESFHKANTYVSDDYFGLLDNGEGSAGNSDKVDIGIGRFPVATVAEARAMVDKVAYYLQNNNRTMWKNTVLFIGDDEDNNLHMRDANLLADKVARMHPEMIVDKILLDAYQQVIGASGPSYPAAEQALQKNLKNGVLLLNYSGHGGISGLTDEKIFTKEKIKSLDNLNSLPVWVTATCDFSRFDLAEENSAGELVLQSSNGGGISLFTTTRLVFSSSNYTINDNFFNYAFECNEKGESMRLGDICMETKRATGTGANKRKFVLLGDPGIGMVLPKLRVKTATINGRTDFETTPDTLAALQKVAVSGYIERQPGDTATDFNGSVIIKVYDKQSNLATLMNDPAPNLTPLKFNLWNNVIFNGRVPVENGNFSFEFVVPKEIDYKIGRARIVYYATSPNHEANGYTEGLTVGGFNEEFEIDEEGPDVKLYLNSPGFTDGSTVNSTPLLIAEIFDKSGINTSGSGIGHNIVAIIDNNPLQYYILNDFYTPVSGYSEGIVKFKLPQLTDGKHTLSFRVWDIYNNSTLKEVSFYVESGENPDVYGLFCYPNPANNRVFFEFEHNRPESVLDVTVEILKTNGQIATRINRKVYSVGNRVTPIEWNLMDATGRKLPRGLYFYRIIVSADGKKSEGKAQKLVVN